MKNKFKISSKVEVIVTISDRNEWFKVLGEIEDVNKYYRTDLRKAAQVYTDVLIADGDADDVLYKTNIFTQKQTDDIVDQFGFDVSIRFRFDGTPF